jgi:hypothetical protein
MKPSPSLSELQLEMKRVLTGHSDLDSFTLRDWIKETKRLPIAARLEIYKYAYLARIVEALGEDFPTLRRAMGSENFTDCISAYLEVHPSNTPNIGECGFHLPQFIRGLPAALERPWLPSLAELELFVIESFYATETPSMDFASLATVAPERWSEAILGLDASVRLLQSDWKVGICWKNRENSKWCEPSRATSAHLIFRAPQGHVSLEELGPTEFAVLQRISERKKLADVFDGMDTDVSFNEMFSKWVQKGIVRDVQFQGVCA